MIQNCADLLEAVDSGRGEFSTPDRFAAWLKFIELFKRAVQAERDGLIQGLEVRRSKRVQTYGWPVKFKVRQVTPLGQAHLAEHRRRRLD